MVTIGVVDRRGQTNARFVAFVALINRSEAKIRQIATIYVVVVMLTTC